MSKVLIVTGMHRSGTSLTASLLQSLGVDLGHKLLEADSYNPKGYFEDCDFVQFQRSILQGCCNGEDLGWPDWGWTEREKLDRRQLSQYVQPAKALIQHRVQQSSDSTVWGWKDPRTSLLLDFWDALLTEARYLFVYRFPWDVVDSVLRLNSVAFFNRPHWALKAWSFYNRHLLEFYQKNAARCVLVNINSCLQELDRFGDLLQSKLNLNPIESDGHALGKIYDRQGLKSLSWSHPLIGTLLAETPQIIQQLAELDRVADLPSNFSLNSLETEFKTQEFLPLSLAAKTPEVKTVSNFDRHPETQISVSVIIPCFNQGEFILEAIASVQRCQEKVYEIIIVNDCSTDALTGKVLNYLRERNYQIIDHPKNQGLAEARNTGIQQSKGRYILPLDADNKIKPQYLTKAMEILDDRPEVGIVYGDMEIFGDKQEIREVPDLDVNLLVQGNYIDACAVLRKTLWEDCGGYDANIPNKLGFEDWDLWLTAVEKGWQFYHLREVLFEYRFRLDSMVSRCNIPENRQQLIRYLCAKHIELYTTNFAEVFATKEFELLSAQTHAEVLQAQVREYEHQCQTHQEDLKSAHNQLYEARVEAQKNYDRLRESELDHQETHKQLYQTQNEVQEAHKQLYQTQNEVQEAHKRLKVSIEDLQNTHAQLHQLRQDNQQTHQRLKESIEEIQQTHAKLNQSHQDNKQTQQTLNQANLQIQNLGEHIQQLSQQLNHTRTQIEAMENTKFWKLREIWLKLKSPWKQLKPLLSRFKAFFEAVKTHGWRYGLRKVAGKIKRKLGLGSDGIAMESSAISAISPHQAAYQHWMGLHAPRAADLRKMAETIPTFRHQPTISIIVPVYNTPEKFLRDAIQSVLNQVYPYWELCIADDNSTADYIKPVLEEYAAKDSRIKLLFRRENGHISRASNSAIELATGEFIGLLDHDDLLTPDALYEVALLINQHPEADMIYSDEDKADEANNIMHPFFKPDWCPDSFLSRMYTCHFGVYRRSIVEEMGGFRVGYEGSQDYDLVLRFTEKTDNIYHIPKILYHWRIHSESTAAGEATVKTYAYEAAKKAITEAIDRRGEPGQVLDVPEFFGNYLVRYKIKAYKKVSIIIPTRDLAGMLDRCLNSIFTHTTYPNYEVIVVDNGSVEPETNETIARWIEKEPERFKCYPLDIPFNYPKLNNFGVEKADGDYLLFLNNDTEILTPDWLEAMVEQAQRPSIGAVGGLLLYGDDSIQHAGVIMGIGGLAGHSHRMFPKDSPGYVCQLKTINNYSVVTGACLMCRREVFEAVGGLDETLEVAYNDVDFCLKLIDGGYRNIYLPHVVLSHYESKSRGYEDTPEKLARLAREAVIIRSRWQKYVDRDPCYNPHLTRGLEDYSINLDPPKIHIDFEDFHRQEKQVFNTPNVEPLNSETNGAVQPPKDPQLNGAIEPPTPSDTEETHPSQSEVASLKPPSDPQLNGAIEAPTPSLSEETHPSQREVTSVATDAPVALLVKEEESIAEAVNDPVEEVPPTTPSEATIDEDETQIHDRLRRGIATQYIRGEGIEIGALHSPLEVPSAATVRYVDRMSVFDLRLQYPEMKDLPLVNVDIIDDGECLETIADNSLDFVIANHMIEHCQNPIGTLNNYLRVLKAGGVIYLAIPDKRYTFDRDRPVTSLEHLIRDYTEGPEWSRISHFEEYVRMVDRMPEKKVSHRLRHLSIDLDYSIHFHVWTPGAFTELLLYCQKELSGGFEIELMQSNGSEFIAVLRKGDRI